MLERPLAGGNLIDAGAFTVAYSWRPWRVRVVVDYSSNRAKSRVTADPGVNLLYQKWGYSWLVNRRVFYNNGEVPGDQSRLLHEPRLVAVFAPKVMPANTDVFNYSPLVSHGRTALRQAAASGRRTPTGPRLAGRFPGHTSSRTRHRRPDLVAAWGYNTTTDTAINEVAVRETASTAEPRAVR